MRSGQAGVRYGPATTSEKITLAQGKSCGKVGVIFYWDSVLGNKAIFLIPMPLAVENPVD